MSKNKIGTGGLVYSTNPDIIKDDEGDMEPETLSPSEQTLVVQLDSKHRAGKIVTLISGFVGTTNDLETLGKMLKTKCGTGGSAKDGLIIIQGDYKLKVVQVLQQFKYRVKSK